eukprot:TRINITY_DN21962_c0_g1_i1.p1 TRINITY_DN21962_c0_g1~~TRINITY_DN21962_c0_g1_i1.p1  ORF type:complete len:451 (+),score=79.65 TRINITY_DN21962_c0_g1_i1:45-1355(+)
MSHNADLHASDDDDFVINTPGTGECPQELTPPCADTADTDDEDEQHDFILSKIGMGEGMSFLTTKKDDALIMDVLDDLSPEYTCLRRKMGETIPFWKQHSCPSATSIAAQVTLATVELIGPSAKMEDNYAVENINGATCGVVCDGHGGSEVAALSVQDVIKEIKKGLEKGYVDLPHVVFDAILEVDLKLFQLSEQNNKFNNQGSTITVVTIKDHEGVVGWLGDSRAVLCVNDKAVDLTRDHNQNSNEEKDRQMRIMGDEHLQLPSTTRALGDFTGKSTLKDRKDQAVSNQAEVTSFRITENTQFIISASDGLWDGMSSQEAVEIVNGTLRNTQFAKEDIDKLLSTPVGVHRCEEDFVKAICSSLITKATQSRSNDNITVQVFLLHDIHSYWRSSSAQTGSVGSVAVGGALHYMCESPAAEQIHPHHCPPYTPPRLN